MQQLIDNRPSVHFGPRASRMSGIVLALLVPGCGKQSGSGNNDASAADAPKPAYTVVFSDAPATIEVGQSVLVTATITECDRAGSASVRLPEFAAVHYSECRRHDLQWRRRSRRPVRVRFQSQRRRCNGLPWGIGIRPVRRHRMHVAYDFPIRVQNRIHNIGRAATGCRHDAGHKVQLVGTLNVALSPTPATLYVGQTATITATVTATIHH